MPKAVRQKFGHAIFDAQTGETNEAVKALKGFGGAGVLEIVEDDNGNTYRAVYTVRFRGYVFVLHVFQKKSKVGRKTDLKDIKLIEKRLKAAELLYAELIKTRKN